MPRYILIAGVNGAGKSTLYQALDSIHSMPRVNTDEIVRSFGRWDNESDVLKAAKQAVVMISENMRNKVSFNQETTLCGKSIITNIQKAKQLGYYVEIHYVGLENADIAVERIEHRVKKGGHGIPEGDVRRRYIESLEALKKVIPICDEVVLYDNTEAFNRFAVF